MKPKPNTITIESLAVEFEIRGDDAAVFERYFSQHIERWSRSQKQRDNAEQRLCRDRAIGRRHDDEGVT